MDKHRKAILETIKVVRLQYLKDMLEPFILAGIRQFGLESWEFKTKPSSKTYNPDLIEQLLRGSEKPPSAEMINWLLNHHGVSCVRAVKQPGGSFVISWETGPPVSR